MSSIFQLTVLQKTHEQFTNSPIHRTNNPELGTEPKNPRRKRK
jgi:hypothetical protein